MVLLMASLRPKGKTDAFKVNFYFSAFNIVWCLPCDLVWISGNFRNLDLFLALSIYTEPHVEHFTVHYVCFNDHKIEKFLYFLELHPKSN